MTSDHAPVIAGIDFSAASPAVLRQAVHAAGIHGAPVVAVHVLDSASLAHRAASGGANPAADLLLGQTRRKLEALVATAAPGAQVRIEVLDGSPADELQRLVQATGACLLVIAANDLTKKRLGSIASRCVRLAPCDVLVIRDWQEGNFSKVVVCTDFSPSSARALERGISLAAGQGARLDIVHVMYPPSRDVWGEVLEHAADSPLSYAEECRANVDRDMRRFLEPHAAALAEIEHHPVILESVSSSLALTHHIQDSGADLVVLGTRGHSKLSSFFLGTNAERLLHDATVSVLAVRI
jgi:nucleotide-binding universal stress UspA family protein